MVHTRSLYINLLISIAIVIVGFATVYPISTPIHANQEDTCPQTNGWIKIDNDNYAPVSGATQYCFKAGSSKSNGCNGGLFYSWPLPAGSCGLSHWSYYIPRVSPSPSPSRSPEASDHPGCSPRISPSPSASPSEEPSPSPSQEPSPSPSEVSSPVPSPSPSPDPSPSPEVSPVPSPSPSTQASSTPSPSSTPSNESSNTTSNTTQSQGEVLGATLGETGVGEDIAMSGIGSLGGLMTAVGSVLYGKKKRH